MRLSEFREVAARMWEEIPEPLKEGVEAVLVEEESLPHPHIEEVYTLGECAGETWGGAWAGPGESVSILYLYHGSFEALARLDPAFDWEGELWETILHELLHHREYAAGEAGLEDYDYAVEQNQLRYADRPFDPTFYRAVPPGPDGSVRIESEIFIEAEVPRAAAEADFAWRGRRYTVRVPPDEEAPLFVQVENLAHGRLWVVVWRRRPWWRRLLPLPMPRPVEVARRALPARAA